MLFTGIDWSDQALDFHLRTADGQVLAEGTVRPNLEGLATLYGKLDVHASPDQIGIAIETSHGAWMQSLLDHGYRIYPVNPKSVDSFRKALSANGNKSDAIDRKVLAMFLVTFHQDLRPLQPDDPEIIALRIACEDRVRLVNERTAKRCELEAILKIYYPAFAGLFGDFDSQITLEFLQQFPTQTQMQGLTPGRLRGWLKRHAYTCGGRIEAMTAMLKKPALPVPEHLQKAKGTMIRFLATSLIALKAEIAQREGEIDDRWHELVRDSLNAVKADFVTGGQRRRFGFVQKRSGHGLQGPPARPGGADRDRLAGRRNARPHDHRRRGAARRRR